MTTTQTTPRKTTTHAKHDVPEANMPLVVEISNELARAKHDIPGLEALASHLSTEELRLLAKRPDALRSNIENAIVLCLELEKADAKEAKVRELAARLAPELGEEIAERVAREKLDADAERKADAEAQLQAELRRARAQEQSLVEEETRARFDAERKAKTAKLLEDVQSSARTLLQARREILNMHPGDGRHARVLLGKALRGASFEELSDFINDADLWTEVRFG
jgi:chromosome segregation ATPase